MIPVLPLVTVIEIIKFRLNYDPEIVEHVAFTKTSNITSVEAVFLTFVVELRLGLRDHFKEHHLTMGRKCTLPRKKPLATVDITMLLGLEKYVLCFCFLVHSA